MTTKKNVIITGAASGIGLALAQFFAYEGYNLSLIDINKIPQLESGGQIEYYNQDITDFEKTEKCIEKIIKKIKTVDILVNDAGILTEGFLDVTTADAHKLLHTNVLAHFNITKIVAQTMKKQKSGYIFNIASRSGLDARPQLGIYSMSKFALMAFNEALYEEMAKFNVRVTALCPSVVNTPMGKGSDLAQDDMIPTKDIINTLNFLLNLSENTYIRELYIDCHKSLLKRLG